MPSVENSVKEPALGWPMLTAARLGPGHFNTQPFTVFVTVYGRTARAIRRKLPILHHGLAVPLVANGLGATLFLDNQLRYAGNLANGIADRWIWQGPS